MTRNLMNHDDHNDKAGLEWSGKSQGSLDFIQGQEVVKSLFKVSEKSGNFIVQSGFRKINVLTPTTEGIGNSKGEGRGGVKE